MTDIKTFLTHMEQPRLLEERQSIEFSEDEMIKPEEQVRSPQNKSEQRETVLLGKEEVFGRISRNNKDRDEIRKLLLDQKAELQKRTITLRTQMKTELAGIMKERDEIKKKLNAKREKEKVLIDFCKLEKPVYEEMEKAMKDLHEAELNPELVALAKKQMKNAFIMSKIEKLNTAITNYDVPNITALIEEIHNLKINVDPGLIEKAEERLEEVKKNPNIVAEKQKELQKLQGKGKKKVNCSGSNHLYVFLYTFISTFAYCTNKSLNDFQQVNAIFAMLTV